MEKLIIRHTDIMQLNNDTIKIKCREVKIKLDRIKIGLFTNCIVSLYKGLGFYVETDTATITFSDYDINKLNIQLELEY